MPNYLDDFVCEIACEDFYCGELVCNEDLEKYLCPICEDYGSSI